jgi:hypothetical protein
MTMTSRLSVLGLRLPLARWRPPDLDHLSTGEAAVTIATPLEPT